MASIFTKIINRDIPAHIVAEDEHHLAFLDINPLQKGHTLVIPKEEIDVIFDMAPRQLGDLHIFSQRVAHAIKKTFSCNRVGVIVMGLEVPHAHIHLIPINCEKDMNFHNPKLKLESTTLQDIANQINKNL